METKTLGRKTNGDVTKFSFFSLMNDIEEGYILNLSSSHPRNIIHMHLYMNPHEESAVRKEGQMCTQ